MKKKLKGALGCGLKDSLNLLASLGPPLDNSTIDEEKIILTELWKRNSDGTTVYRISTGSKVLREVIYEKGKEPFVFFPNPEVEAMTSKNKHRPGKTTVQLDESTVLELRRQALPGEVLEDLVRRLAGMAPLARKRPAAARYRKADRSPDQTPPAPGD